MNMPENRLNPNFATDFISNLKQNDMRLKNRQRWRLVLTTLLLMVGMLTASAQTQTVKGVVTSAADGEPLIGATVMVKETKAGTVTDFDGNFVTKAAKGQTLVISYIVL